MKFRRSLLATVLTALVAVLPVFAAPGAMISPIAGSVNVNGRAIAAGSSLLPGDQVAVSPASSARLVFAGASILAAANAQFTLARRAEAINLNYGVLKVSGAVPVHSLGRAIRAASPAGLFSVIRLRHAVYVHALRGAVVISGVGRPYTVAAGHAARYSQYATGSAAGSSATVSPVAAVAIAVAAGLVTGIVVHEVTKCSNCVASPSY